MDKRIEQTIKDRNHLTSLIDQAEFKLAQQTSNADNVLQKNSLSDKKCDLPGWAKETIKKIECAH